MLRMLSTTIVFLLCLALAWFALACACSGRVCFRRRPRAAPTCRAASGAERLWLETRRCALRGLVPARARRGAS